MVAMRRRTRPRRTCAPLPEPEWRNANLRRAFTDVQRALSDAPPAEPGRLKRSLLGPYFRWTGVDGMINPFGLEVIANPDLLPFERPFVVAHEWSHLAGIADEGEANFVGWLTCVRAARAAQYSGWFYLYWQISGEVNDRERARLNAGLADGPRADINAVIARLRRGEVPALQHVSWKVYDEDLKAKQTQSMALNSELRLEIEGLRDPRRIDVIARRQLGLTQPMPTQVQEYDAPEMVEAES